MKYALFIRTSEKSKYECVEMNALAIDCSRRNRLKHLRIRKNLAPEVRNNLPGFVESE